MFTKRMLMAGLAVAVSASAAMAGTKYQSSIVNASATDPPSNPTLAAGKASVKDTGDVAGQIKGVTDGAGVLVEGDTSIKDGDGLTGDEYVLVVKLNFTALGVDVEVPLAMDVKKGNGKAKISLAALTASIPAMTGRSLEVTGGEVWGPLGAGNIAACQAELTAGFSLTGSACKGGTRVGVAGVDIP